MLPLVAEEVIAVGEAPVVLMFVYVPPDEEESLRASVLEWVKFVATYVDKLAVVDVNVENVG